MTLQQFLELNSLILFLMLPEHCCPFVFFLSDQDFIEDYKIGNRCENLS